MAEPLATLDLDGHVAWLTLRRPEKLNALSPELLGTAVSAVADVATNDEIRCLIIRGEGRAFCAGADLNSMAGRTPIQAQQMFGSTNLWAALERLPQPTIAAVHGYCFGGGCELAMACDLRIASADAKFGQPEIKVGIIPGAGGTQRLPRLIGMGRAKELVFFGEPIDADEAYRIGLVNRVVPPDRLFDETKVWAKKLVALPPLGVRAAKMVMDRGADVDLGTAIQIERLGFSALFGTEDQREGMLAFREKRPPTFQGR
ncbi:MAG TPA: enoyl-CoA hydratase-related protein [Chloroflexota bacterium]|nr:enoyl-CoA hydratase-related protein [Chloroflexota bacterium]